MFVFFLYFNVNVQSWVCLLNLLLISGCRFINLQVSSLTDKWYGESQKLAAAVFSLVSVDLFFRYTCTCIHVSMFVVGLFFFNDNSTQKKNN